MFHFTVETEKTLDQAVQDLEKELKEDSFGVLWDFNVKETLNKKGFDFDQTFRILEVCNPKEAKEVLSLNSLVSYFLPCKIVVYENGDKNYIGMPKPTMFMENIDDPALKEKAKVIEDRLVVAINKAK
ncbi:DUF302 domain-containing protein [Bacillaceae bacterium S4-13-58]